MIERQRFSPVTQLAILLVLTGTGLIAGSFIVVALEHALAPLAKQAGKTGGALLSNITLTRLAQVVGTIFLFIIPAYIFTYIAQGPPTMQHMGFTQPISRKQVLLVVLMFVAGFFVGNALELINLKIPLTKGLETTFKQWEDDYDKQAATLGAMRTGGEYVIALFILALLPAIAEEMLFRGCLQKVMINVTRSALAGILVTSILFSLMHGSYYGFLIRLFLGCLLGYIYYYSKNIWLNIAVHFLNNAFVVTTMYTISKGGGAVAAEGITKNVPIFNFLIMGTAAAAGLLYLFRIFRQESALVVATHREENIYNDSDNRNLL